MRKNSKCGIEIEGEGAKKTVSVGLKLKGDDVGKKVSVGDGGGVSGIFGKLRVSEWGESKGRHGTHLKIIIKLSIPPQVKLRQNPSS